MPDIAPISPGNLSATERTAAVHARFDLSPASDPARRAPRSHDPADSVEVSDHARLLSKLREMPDVRFTRVQEIRQAIEDGSYESEARLDSALEGLIADIRDL